MERDTTVNPEFATAVARAFADHTGLGLAEIEKVVYEVMEKTFLEEDSNEGITRWHWNR